MCKLPDPFLLVLFFAGIGQLRSAEKDGDGWKSEWMMEKLLEMGMLEYGEISGDGRKRRILITEKGCQALGAHIYLWEEEARFRSEFRVGAGKRGNGDETAH